MSQCQEQLYMISENLEINYLTKFISKSVIDYTQFNKKNRQDQNKIEGR